MTPLSARALLKRAEGPTQAEVNRDAWRKVLASGLLGLGAGAGLRGLVGLRNMITRPPAVDSGSSVPSELAIYTPPPPEEEEEGSLRKAGSLLRKEASFLGLGSPTGDARRGVNWWQLPLGIGLGAGGIYGGWKLVDALLAKRREKEQEADLGDAKKEYEATLLEAAKAHSKQSSAASQLDALYDDCCALEKRADPASGRLGDYYQGTAGVLATVMALTALGTGVGTYSWMKRRSKQKLLEDAIEARRRQRAQPQPIYAYSAPWPTEKKKKKTEAPAVAGA